MKPNWNLFWAFALAVLVFVGGNAALSFVFWLASQPSDFAVFAAVVLGIGVIGGIYRAGNLVYRLFRKGLGFAALLTLLSGCAGCERIDAGHVGIKIQMAGTNRGVQSIPLVTGYVLYNPITEDVLEYPTFMQTALWSRPRDGESASNEELSFNDKDGVRLTADMSLSYQLQPQKVPAFYVKFRTDDLSTFTHGFLRNVARDHLNEVAGTYSVEALYGPKKEEVVHAVKARINADLKNIGVTIEQLGFIGAPRPPDNVITAINAKVSANQTAMQAENELRRERAEAEKRVAAADGEARVKLALAEGEAKSKIAVAQGEATANDLLTRSITPVVLEWRKLRVTEVAVEKWDGKRPTVEGANAGLLLQVTP